MFFCLISVLTVSAQKMGKPTIVPTEATAEQKQIIEEGIRLHDEKKYDEAIKKYEQVLKENPNNDLAVYEMALSLYNKKDFTKATETAYRLIQFKSKTGILGYGLIANVLDDQGKPKEAIEIYQKAIKQLADDASLNNHTSSLYYNLGLTHFRQKQYLEAREALKKSVQNNFAYPSPNYLLAIIFDGTKYKVPALLAAARLLSLEMNTERSKNSAAVILSVLNSAKKDEKTGNVQIFMDINAPKDEGDFGMYDLLLGTLVTMKDEKDKNKSKTEIFAEAVDTLISLLSEDKKLPKTFVGKTYIPFMAEMKKSGHSKTFAYVILQQNGDKDALKWLVENEKSYRDFLNWSRNYQLK